MMMALFAAAAAASATPAQPVLSNDPDVRCMAAYLVAAGDAKDDATVTADDRTGIQSIVMYFFGKLDARRPGSDIRGEIMTLVGSQNYGTMLRPDMERCSAEAEIRGRYLSSFGEAAETPAPKP